MSKTASYCPSCVEAFVTPLKSGRGNRQVCSHLIQGYCPPNEAGWQQDISLHLWGKKSLKVNYVSTKLQYDDQDFVNVTEHKSSPGSGGVSSNLEHSTTNLEKTSAKRRKRQSGLHLRIRQDFVNIAEHQATIRGDGVASITITADVSTKALGITLFQ
jgi:hypothetical protein